MGVLVSGFFFPPHLLLSRAQHVFLFSFFSSLIFSSSAPDVVLDAVAADSSVTDASVLRLKRRRLEKVNGCRALTLLVARTRTSQVARLLLL